MKRAYQEPVVEKITFDYKAQIVTSGEKEDCQELIANEREKDSTSTVCVGGTPFSLGWNDPQTLVP